MKKYRVYDINEKKEILLENVTSNLGPVGSTRRITIRRNGKDETHHVEIREVIKE